MRKLFQLTIILVAHPLALPRLLPFKANCKSNNQDIFLMNNVVMIIFVQVLIKLILFVMIVLLKRKLRC